VNSPWKTTFLWDVHFPVQGHHDRFELRVILQFFELLQLRPPIVAELVAEPKSQRAKVEVGGRDFTAR